MLAIPGVSGVSGGSYGTKASQLFTAGSNSAPPVTESQSDRSMPIAPDVSVLTYVPPVAPTAPTGALPTVSPCSTCRHGSNASPVLSVIGSTGGTTQSATGAARTASPFPWHILIIGFILYLLAQK